ncbi:MAG: hypothetical protein ABIE43_05150 [Patescibacteria group bacterium]
MYYRLKYGKNYIVKIIILVLAAVLGELLIWWGMVREDSVDWIAGKIVHNPWPYAITELEDGKTIVGNVIFGFEVTLPVGWKAQYNKHPTFYLEEDNLVCEIKSNIVKYNEEIEIGKLLKEQEGFSGTYINGFTAIKKEETTSEGNFIYELQIPIKKDVIIYTMFASKDNQDKCKKEFEIIKRSFLYY